MYDIVYIFEKNLGHILCTAVLPKSIENEDLIGVLDQPIQNFTTLETESWRFWTFFIFLDWVWVKKIMRMLQGWWEGQESLMNSEESWNGTITIPIMKLLEIQLQKVTNILIIYY